MALFVRKPTTNTDIPIYNLSHERTVLVVGLGNIGQEYDGTRHNIGFACVDHFAQKNEFPDWVNKKDLKCQQTSKTLGGTRVIIIKPTTFMNASGEAAFSTQQFYKIHTHDVLVVHDELDIPFGQIRVRAGGGSAGNNGVKSLQQHLDGEFTRVRVGIANEFSARADSADFVLGKFTSDEQGHIKSLTSEVETMITQFVFGGSLEPTTLDYRD
ncbi:aminoacyl-tRNA hydrolase [Candidatus Saccharibacteria bacterium]|nr:aminoacyl-tRNA hydrolase [Candidatus Saccharibacteria bacterium]